MATVDLSASVTNPTTQAGAAPTYTTLSASNTYTFPVTRQTMLHFKKTGANSCTVTLVTPATDGSLAVADNTTVVVPATTGDMMVAGFDPQVYGNANGTGSFTVSEATGLSVAVVQLPQNPTT